AQPSIWRKTQISEIVRGPYSHWAVCVGNGEVVHFGTPGKNQCSSQTSGSSIDGVGGIVKKEKLEDVAGKDSWRVNNILDEKYKPLPPDEIVKKACSLVEASPTYNLTKYNCEHFATEMRYGIAESSQVQKTVETVATAAAAAAAASVSGVATSVIGGISHGSTY
uniref:LRAT domain-containing protein n=1 Tax=Oryzias sinensis TaxID=183150 RepID=A0A8C8DEE6_9TELE